MMTSILIAVALSVICAGAIGWYLGKSRSAAVYAEREMLLRQLSEVKKEFDQERRKTLELTDSLAATEADYRNLQEKLADQKQEVEKVQANFAAEFKNLANEIFEEKSKRFTEENKSSIGDLLRPLGEKINAFEKKIDETHRDAVEKNAGLFSELHHLKDLNMQMSEDARNLTRALKGDARTQGSWGELILESILESSGLEKGREYTIQESFRSPEGRVLRPDVIVHLPNEKHVIIDSKVSLTAYDKFVNSETDEDKQVQLKAHLQSMRQHLRLLHEKNYQNNFSENGLDFVMMFIPIEPAYILAIQNDPKLYEDALEKRIMFVSPTLLIPSLQLIKNVWKQEYQNRHVLDIAKKAGDLYDKFVGFTEDLITLGRHLDSSKKYYEESMKKLSVGSGNLVRKVEDLRKLGAKASKNMDQKLLSKSEEQGDLFE